MGVLGLLVQALVLLLCALDYLLFFIPCPVDVKPNSIKLKARQFEGPLAINEKLSQAEKLYEGELYGPESIAVDNAGALYTGLSDGRIVKLEGGKVTDIVRTGKPPCDSIEREPDCGRPLGMRFDRYGTNLIVADAYYGILEVNPKARTISTLVPPNPGVDDKPFRFLNDLDIARDGTIYFTDSSTKWQRRYHIYAILEGDDTGRLLVYHPKTGEVEVLIDGIHFANGVQLSPEGDFVLVAETGTARILKHHLRGEDEGKTEVFIDNLPGLPDNIRPSSHGGYWVGIAVVRKEPFIADMLMQYPRARKFICKLPLSWLEALMLEAFIPKHSMLLELSESGQIIQTLHDPSGKSVLSSSEIHDDHDVLYIGSYKERYLAKLKL